MMDVLRSALIKARDQFNRYAESHHAQGKTDKAATNLTFAAMCDEALGHTVAPAEAGAHMHVIHHADGTTEIQHYGEAHVVPGTERTVFFTLPPGATDYVVTRRVVPNPFGDQA